MRLSVQRRNDRHVDAETRAVPPASVRSASFLPAPKVHRVCVPNLVKTLFPLRLGTQVPC